MRISNKGETEYFGPVLAKPMEPEIANPAEEGWLADVYRYSSTVRQAQRASQRMLDRLNRYHAAKEQSSS
jgi:hypothetical protein